MKEIFYPSQYPGAYERHFLRRNENPLFGLRQTDPASDNLQRWQAKDHDILQGFIIDFRELLGRVTQLKANENSDVILEIKDRLDALYSQSACVADDQSLMQESIKKLLDVVTQSIRKSANDNKQALQELEQEEKAREANFKFLESNLVADILDPKSPIENNDLLPTLLSAEKDDLALAVQLFDEKQMGLLLSEGSLLLEGLNKKGSNTKKAIENFGFMESYLSFLKQQ